MAYHIIYPLIHLRMSDSWKSSFPSLLLHLISPLATALRIVEGLNDASLETSLMLKNWFLKLPSIFFSIRSSCSLIGINSVVIILTPLIFFDNHLRSQYYEWSAATIEFAPPLNYYRCAVYRRGFRLYFLSSIIFLIVLRE